jgi:hypothetical protein
VAQLVQAPAGVLMEQSGGPPVGQAGPAGAGVEVKCRCRPGREAAGEENPPNEQCRVMDSVGLSALVRAGAGAKR